MIDSVKLVTIPVRDQERALAFYTKTLGFKTVTDQPMNPEAPAGTSPRWIELKIQGVDTHVVLFTAPGQEDLIGRFAPIVFGCADVAKTHAELVKKGVEFVQPPKKEAWGTSALFKDIDGNTFCLSSR